jgi:ribonuclease Z
MKVTILGSGTCASQLPNIPNRYPPGFLVEFGDEKILFDCSEGIRFRLEQAGYNYADIHHVALTHIHPDHFALVHFLQSIFGHGLWGGKKNNDITVYCPQEIRDKYPDLLKAQIHSLDHPSMKTFPKVKFEVMNGNSRQIGGGTLSAEKVYHEFGLVDAVAFRLETNDGIFVYSGDTGECPGIRKICQNADIFVCEASARVGDENSPLNYGHLNPRLAGEIAKQGNVKKMILFHYTGLDSDETIVQDCRKSGFAGEIIVGKDFQTI